ncbi:diguanylate cyclase [Pseudidiomarina sp.]|uniref:sensor domain-containing diguanylate cyclase n=1 Tax=Pseudidiomarina sp. TaxID=2081707 RepID=UPI003A972CF4
MAEPIDNKVFEYAVEQAYDSVLITDAALESPGPRILYANSAFCRKTGYTLKELVGQSPRILQGPLTDKNVLNRLRQNLIDGERFEGATVNYRKDGSAYIVRWSISPVHNAAGKITHFVSIQRDITHESELEKFNEQILDSLPEGVVGIDINGLCTFVNPVALKALGYDDEQDIIGKPSHALFHHSHPNGEPFALADCQIHKAIKAHRPLKNWRDTFWTKANTCFPVEVSVTPLMSETNTDFGGVFIFRDISEQLKIEQNLKRAAEHDQLTGAYNRRFGDSILRAELERSQRYGVPASLLIFDIDLFKEVNDSFGHLAGDAVLKNLVTLTQNRLRESDVLIRWGGEEFLVLLPNTDLSGAMQFAESLRKSIHETTFSDVVTNISVSIGVCAASSGDDLDAWILRVDKALYKAKENGRNQVVACS